MNSRSNKKTQKAPKKNNNNNNNSAKALTNGGSRSKQRPSKAPVAQVRQASSSRPSLKSGANSIRVRHRELIANVAGTTSFAISKVIALNPGMAESFPWLSGIARNWDEYVAHQLHFEYLTRTGTGTAGSVIMAPDYDASDAPPGSELIMSAFQDAQESAPWKDIFCKLNPPAMKGGMSRKFVRSSELLANQDVKTYDVGNFYVATTDAATAAPWGKLWVVYDIEFFVPAVHVRNADTMVSGEFTAPALDGYKDNILFEAERTLTTSALLVIEPSVVSGPDRLRIDSPGEYIITVGMTNQTGNLGLGARPPSIIGGGIIADQSTVVSADLKRLMQNFVLKQVAAGAKFDPGNYTATGTRIDEVSLACAKVIIGSIQT